MPRTWPRTALKTRHLQAMAGCVLASQEGFISASRPVSFGPRTSPGASDRPLMCSIQREYPSSVSTLPQGHHQWASSPTTWIFPFWDDGTRVTHTVPGLGHPLLEKLPHPPHLHVGGCRASPSFLFALAGFQSFRRPRADDHTSSLPPIRSSISSWEYQISSWDGSLVAEPRRPRPSSPSSSSAILMMACKQGQGWTWTATGILMGCVWIHVLDKKPLYAVAPRRLASPLTLHPTTITTSSDMASIFLIWHPPLSVLLSPPLPPFRLFPCGWTPGQPFPPPCPPPLPPSLIASSAAQKMGHDPLFFSCHGASLPCPYSSIKHRLICIALAFLFPLSLGGGLLPKAIIPLTPWA